MSEIDDGGPAYPHINPNYDGNWDNQPQRSGMTLRDYFAIHAAWEDVRHYSTDSNGRNLSRVGARYKYADCMIAARKANK